MSGPNGDMTVSLIESILDDDDEFDEQEFAAINSMLDQINSYLDDLEERNDALNGKIHDLLESNRQARQEFRAQLNGSSTQETPDSGKETVTEKEENSSLNEKNQEKETENPQMSGDNVLLEDDGEEK